MMRSGSAYRLILGIVLALAAGGAAPQQGPGLLRKHPTNGRYFTDDSGKAVYLTGSHSWDTFQRFLWTSNPSQYFNILQANNHNFMRFWVADTAWSPFVSAFVEPQPYVRTGPGLAADGQPRFNLDQLNQAYFNQLRSIVVQARDRGIYVSLMLFDSWGVSRYDGPEHHTWPYHPFRAGNNVNNVNGDPNGTGKGRDYHSLNIPAVVQRQEAYVRKVVDTVNDLDNVLYEICNEEYGVAARDWQYHLINVIRNHQAGKPKQHPIGMTAHTGENNEPQNGWLYASPADWVSPQSILAWDSTSEPYAIDPPVADPAKVSLADTDHFFYYNFQDNPTLTRQWAWKSFLRGHNPILMEDLSSRSGWIAARAAMSRTRTTANRIDLAAMTPQNGLSTTAYCLANPGSEYLAYQPGNGSFSVYLQAGTYSVEWFNTVAGTTSTSANVTVSTAWRSFTPPSAEATLYLKRTSAPPATYSLTASPSSVSPGQTVTVSWTAPAGSSAVDWIAIFAASAPDTNPVDPTWATGWIYTGGATSGATGFAAPGPGTYNFRYFLNDGWQKVATSNTVTVTGGTTVPNLAGHWKFNEGSGGFAGDSSGNGNHGSLVNAGWTSGKEGSALSVNGGYVNVPSTSSLNSPRTGMTIAMWINQRSVVQPYGILAGRRWGPGWDDLWVLFTNNDDGQDRYCFGVRTSTAAFVTGPSSLGDLNTWVHIAGTYDGTRVRIYRNGTEIGSTPLTGTIPLESSPLLIGAGDNGNTGLGEYLNAALDDVRLYDRALSASELQALAGGSSPTTVYVSDLSWTYAVSGWGPVERDRSNGENNGGDGTTMRLNGVSYAKGLGCHAYSEIRYALGGQYTSFQSDVGVDDELDTNPYRSSSIVFQVWADGVKLYDSGVMTWTSATKSINVSVAGKQELRLIVTDAGDNIWYDHADWAGARLTR